MRNVEGGNEAQFFTVIFVHGKDNFRIVAVHQKYVRIR